MTKIWDFHVEAYDLGERRRVVVTGRTSQQQIVREGYSAIQELIRIVGGKGSNVQSDNPKVDHQNPAQ